MVILSLGEDAHTERSDDGSNNWYNSHNSEHVILYCLVPKVMIKYTDSIIKYDNLYILAYSINIYYILLDHVTLEIPCAKQFAMDARHPFFRGKSTNFMGHFQPVISSGHWDPPLFCSRVPVLVGAMGHSVKEQSSAGGCSLPSTIRYSAIYYI